MASLAEQKQRELQRVRAERAQVEAEIAKIRGESAPTQPSVRTVSNGAATSYTSSSGAVPKPLLLALAAGLGFWLWSRRKKR